MNQIKMVSLGHYREANLPPPHYGAGYCFSNSVML